MRNGKHELLHRALDIETAKLRISKMVEPHLVGDERELSQLERFRDTDTQSAYIDFRRCDGNVTCNLSIDIGGSMASKTEYGYEPIADEKGDLYFVSTVDVGVNWPSHGSSGLAMCHARVNLYREVVDLAAEIEAAFTHRPIKRLYLTKAEHEEKQSIAKKAKIDKTIVETLLLHANVLKGMRLAHSRCITHARVTDDVPLGAYDGVVLRDKSYTVKVHSDDVIEVVRTA